MKTLPELKGNNLNHTAYLVQTGVIERAIAFFVELFGWTLDNSVVRGVWGEARFLKPPGTVRVQITEHLDRRGNLEVFPGTHLAINVKNPRDAAVAIRNWADKAGWECFIEPANNEETKWFVALPAMLAFKLELV